jgi:CheY-like chemotaxis protein
MSKQAMVLYADDDNDDLQLLRDAFSQYSKDVNLVTVTDGLNALSFLENLPEDAIGPCLIILDINMPRINGKEALIRLRQIDRYKEVPVILFTTSTYPVDMEFARKYDAGFITKPINVTQLERIADTFIEYCTDAIKKKIRR